jgi:hypothetical protein
MRPAGLPITPIPLPVRSDRVVASAGDTEVPIATWRSDIEILI